MDREYWVISRELAAQFLSVPESAVHPPLSYWLPAGLVAAVLGGVLALLLALFGRRLVEALERKFPPDGPAQH